MCRTPEEAFALGLAQRCPHDLAPAKCRRCRLDPAEIPALVALLRPGLQRPAANTAA